MDSGEKVRFENADKVEKHPLEEVESFEEHMKRKTVEEKAKEKGYYKKEDGSWWQTYGDGFDEPVEYFKLDEEYPELADRTEELAEKYNVKYNDYSGLKKYVYKNADLLSGASDEQLSNIFRIAGAISFSTGGTDELLVGYNADKLEVISAFLDKYYGAVADLMPDQELDERITRIGECIVRNYNDKLVEGDFFENLVRYSSKAFSDIQNGEKLINGIKCGINGISENEDSGEFFGGYMEYLDELINGGEKITKYETRAQVFCRYVNDHGVEAGTVEGFRNVIFPLLEQRDDEVRPIVEGGNAYGVAVGTYGVADYVEECLLSSYNPKDINKLVRIYHEIPTSDYEKFEQNRKDAARLQGTIIGGRDFIHDERPGINEMLVAMKDYYDNRESDSVDDYRRHLEELEEKYHFGVLPNAFNVEAYEKPIEYMGSGYNDAGVGNPDETALDVLNRLIENTRPNLLKVPGTKDAELNELMEKISPTLNERTGEVSADFDRVCAAVTKLNEIILQNKGNQGVYPSLISAVAFLDKMSAYAIRSASKRDLQELPFAPGFKEIVRFSQLSCSMKYDESDFDKKYQQIIDKFSEAYKDDNVDSSLVADGYRMLNRYILNNVQDLSKHYTSKSTTKRFSEAVWSGNLSDELIGLFDRI